MFETGVVILTGNGMHFGHENLASGICRWRMSCLHRKMLFFMSDRQLQKFRSNPYI